MKCGKNANAVAETSKPAESNNHFFFIWLFFWFGFFFLFINADQFYFLQIKHLLSDCVIIYEADIKTTDYYHFWGRCVCQMSMWFMCFDHNSFVSHTCRIQKMSMRDAMKKYPYEEDSHFKVLNATKPRNRMRAFSGAFVYVVFWYCNVMEVGWECV